VRLREALVAVTHRRGFLLVGYLILAAIAAVQQWSLPKGDDPYTHYNNYVIFRQAFFHLVSDRELYAQHLAEHWDYFRYSPSFALLFGAFAWMPDLPGLLLWNALNAGALFAAWMMLPLRDHRIALAGGWFVAIEMLTALQNSQSNALIAGLLILAFAFLERRRFATATLMIALAASVKLFALAALSLCVLYPEKRRCFLYSVLWGAGLAVLPLVAVTPAELVNLYADWWQLLVTDYAGSTGLSIMGWLESWFGLLPPKPLVASFGIALFCWPLGLIRRRTDLVFRLLVLASLLIWVVIFNHKAESSTYVIAMCGVAIWLLCQQPSVTNVVLASLALVFTSLSTTELFPRSLQAGALVPYAVKAVPCILVWAKLTYDLISGTYKPRAGLG
jgi:hypothetical protein